ncbi:MAG: phage tail tube protein [Natronomonas sp.]|uniref:phage tail tube protein n=1 Tax=Natronomonas sp. TaxID=2184060 RepID=UPI002870A80D|nr:phage tail tube protein [Natronomonas sp.]MDR9382619.1 phage tail tube protein [Natronomonas sp.]MDR9431728.1 phage tail tube protein [Natronomonas sp.]
MTGAGAGDLAWLHEPVDDYGGSPTDTDYKGAGKDVTVDTLSIDNALSRLNDFSAEAAQYVETTFEGALAISGTLTTDTVWMLNHVYGSEPAQSGSGPYTYTWAPDTIRVQSARFFIGLDYLNGFAERAVKGVAFPEFEVSNNIGETSTFSATAFYRDEELATSATPGSAPTPGDPYVFHGGSFSYGADTLVKMQEATLSINTNAHAQRGWERKADDAVRGNIEYSVTPTKIVTETDLLTDAYGNSTAPATSPNSLTEKDVDLNLSNGDDDLTFACSGAKIGSHDWESIGNAGEDKTEAPELTPTQIRPELTTDEAEAR